MTSLWTGDIAHADIVRHGYHMCVQVNSSVVGDATARASMEKGLQGAHLEQGPCGNQWGHGVYHKGAVSVWVK